MSASGRDGVKYMISGSQIATEAESMPADENAGSSDEEDIWADPCGELADPQDCTGDAYVDSCAYHE